MIKKYNRTFGTQEDPAIMKHPPNKYNKKEQDFYSIFHNKLIPISNYPLFAAIYYSLARNYRRSKNRNRKTKEVS